MDYTGACYDTARLSGLILLQNYVEEIWGLARYQLDYMAVYD